MKAYFKNIHHYSFRPGEPAEIIGVGFIAPPDCDLRACYHVRYDDGVTDHVPIADNKNYQIIPAQDAWIDPTGHDAASDAIRQLQQRVDMITRR